MLFAQDVLAAFEMPVGAVLAYIGALAISGFLLLVAAALPGESVGSRVLNAIVAVALLGYAFYLLFVFDGGEIRIFFYVFFAPFLALFRIFQSVKATLSSRRTEPAAPGAQPAGFYPPQQQPGSYPAPPQQQGGPVQ
jgi:hypothetical protein